MTSARWNTAHHLWVWVFVFKACFAFQSIKAPSLNLQRPRGEDDCWRLYYKQQRDIVVVGGGLAGLSAALYTAIQDPSRHVTIIEPEKPHSNKASLAAAGMLAPHAERLPSGEYLDLCVQSRAMYSDFVELVERLALEHSPSEKSSVGFSARGGFLAPAFAGDSVATWAPTPGEGGAETAVWLDRIQVHELEPSLNSEVIGGWWFPTDASVDAVRLLDCLQKACTTVGVEFLPGTVTSLDLNATHCQGVVVGEQKYLKCQQVLVANGAWMRQLLPVPIQPHKGQSLSLRVPEDQPVFLNRVLFAQDSYIVPKQDGRRIIVGATVEAGSYDAHVTPAGLMHILSYAIQLVPGLADLPIEDTWVGLRPTTPDKGPILGRTPWKNVILGAGYWRNGVLLAPRTGSLLAKLLTGTSLTPDDEAHLQAFAWDRFTNPEKSNTLVANSRYASSMHPVHTRAATSMAAGAELGSYSTARAAQSERQRDRSYLTEADDAALEQAALLGKQDAAAFLPGGVEKPRVSDDEEEPEETWPSMLEKDQSGLERMYEQIQENKESSQASVDDIEEEEEALASLSTNEETNEASPTPDLSATYESIQKNKERAQMQAPSDDTVDDDKPDPGFRIYYVHPETEEEIEVPPYTSPGEFLSTLEDNSAPPADQVAETDGDNMPVNGGENTPVNGGDDEYNEQTYDGYVEILKQNARESRHDELELMKKARQANRVGQTGIDLSKVGAHNPDREYPQP